MSTHPPIDLDTLTLHPKHIADLAGSGILEEQALAAGFRSVSEPHSIGAIIGWGGPVTILGSCLLIPFRDLAGNLIPVLEYARLKPDAPYTRKGKTSPNKYESPKRTDNRPGSPPYFPLGFASMLAAEDPILSPNPIIITEGEKKAYAAQLRGFMTIGLVGVAGWSKPRAKDPVTNKKIGGERFLSDELAAVPWKGRSVRIIFDSDAAHKHDVQREERAFADALWKVGAAEVKIVRLPEIGGAA